MALPAIQQLNSPAVEMTGIGKRFRVRKPAGWRFFGRAFEDKVALHDIDLEVEAGKITGILGANGSGKSTLIRILATLLTPDEGTASVFGFDVVTEADRVRRHVNRVSVEASFFKEMSPWENMLYAARLYGSGGSGTRTNVEAILKRLGLPLDTLDRPMKQLSRGQQQKVAIARSYMTAPSLLLMDEPTTGLDPRSKREVQALLYLLVGALLWSYMSMVFFEIAFGIAWERWEGTIEYTFMAPVKRITHLVGLCLSSLIYGTLRAGLIGLAVVASSR